MWNGTVWQPCDATLLVGVIPNAALAVNPLNRANHTGTQLASTISNLQATVLAYTLDTFAAPVAAVSMNSQRLTNLGAPVGANDAVTLAYLTSQIQSAAAGISGKGAVVAVATTNIATLSGAQTVDGVALAAGMRVLLVGQTTASQNGPYVVQTGAWTRPTTDANNELETGAVWFVEQGTANADTAWILSTPTAGTTITPNTTAIGIVQFNAAANYTAGNGLSKAGNVFSVNAVAGGGIISAAGGVSVDTTIVSRKQTYTITGNGSNTSFVVNHTLNSTVLNPTVLDSNGNVVEVDVQMTSTTTVTVNFGTAPTNGTSYTVFLQG